MNLANRQEAKKSIRSDHGGALIMGIAALFVVVTVIAMGVFFFTHVGIAAYYRDKLEFVARQGAQYAAGELSWADSPRAVIVSNSSTRFVTPEEAKEKTIPIVNKLLQEMGLPSPAQSIDVTADKEQVTVSISVAGLAMPRGTMLPDRIDMRATAQKEFSEDRPLSLLYLHHENSPMIAVVPSYGGIVPSTGNYWINRRLAPFNNGACYVSIGAQPVIQLPHSVPPPP